VQSFSSSAVCAFVPQDLTKPHNRTGENSNFLVLVVLVYLIGTMHIDERTCKYVRIRKQILLFVCSPQAGNKNKQIKWNIKQSYSIHSINQQYT